VADVLIRAAEPGDVDELIANLRDCDRLEVEASAGRHRVERAVRLGVRCSFGTMTSLVDGQVANMFGVTPIDFVQGKGSPWMLATPVFDAHPRAVIRLCRTYIPPMLVLRISSTTSMHATPVLLHGYRGLGSRYTRRHLLDLTACRSTNLK
jgi:hypothetical protein